MAKKIKKTFREQLRDAKSFHEMLALIERNENEQIKHFEEMLKKRDKASKARRPQFEKSVRQHKATLASLVKRRQRFDSIQGNRKIAAVDRKRIAELERDILAYEGDSDSRSALRFRKQELAEIVTKIDRHFSPPKPFATSNAAYKIGKEYPRQSLTRAYDGHVWKVLKGHFEIMPRVKGQQSKAKIAAGLPAKAEYLELKKVHFTKTIDVLVDEAYEEIEGLQEELQEAFDNTPESLQDSEVGQARSEAADQLDNIAGDSPSVPESVVSLQLVHFPALNQVSRADRAGDAADILRAIALAAQQHMSGSAKLNKAEVAEIQDFCNQLEGHADEIDAVEFPGMFG